MSAANASYSVENAKRFGWGSVTGDLHPERIAHLLKYLEGNEILDAGCGGGGYVEFLASRGLRVTGLDCHEQFLMLTSAATRQGKYVVGDIGAMPFPARHFDSAFCYDVLEHVDDVSALRELCRVSRRKVIIAVPAHDQNTIGFGLTFRHYQDLTHLRTYTAESLEGLIRCVGQDSFRIMPELAVDLRSLASDHLTYGKNPSSAGSLWSVRLNGQLRRLYHAIIRCLLRGARYPTIHTGWVAVIDLD